MEKVIALLAGNFEAHKSQSTSGNNGLLASAAVGNRFNFHLSPPLTLPSARLIDDFFPCGRVF